MATNKRLIKSNDEGGAVGASFNTVLYEGNGGTQNITGVEFQPDLVWIKSKNINGANHNIYDSVRGAGKALFSNATLNEYTTTEMVGFSSDGFNFTGTAFDSNNVGNNYVAWCWKAGGAAVTNTDGTITSQVSANTEAGFSIVSYTGTGSAVNNTIGHGLNSTPKMIIIKPRSVTGAWIVYHSEVGTGDIMELNQTYAASGSGSILGYPTDVGVAPTDLVYTVGGSGAVNGINNTYIAYCFAEVAGFSKFGSYSGGSTGSGAEISVGFEPAFVMIKKTDGVSGLAHWWIWDNKRNPSSPYGLQPDLSNAEATDDLIRFTSTGFYFVSTSGEINNSGSNFIYMAFANQF